MLLDRPDETPKGKRLRNDIILEDTTLRDGEQTPGVAFSSSQKLQLLDALIDVGVSHIEVGIPAMGGDELAFLEMARERATEAVRLVVWNRGVAEDVHQSLDLGYSAVHIGLPVSKAHLEGSVRKDRSWLLRIARELIATAKDRGAFVSISAEDVGRVDGAFLQEYAGVVADAGADRLRLSDTIGVLGPAGYAKQVAAVLAACDIDVQCHAHNDFGLATANTLAGLEAGARYFHTTVNGIGERAGMADMAQVVLSLMKLHDVDLGIDLTKLSRLSSLVSRFAGIDHMPWQPVVGDNVFAHESGIHVNGMLRDSTTFEPFPPEEVGNRRRYVLGKHSGSSLIVHLLQQKGIAPEQAAVAATLNEVRHLAVVRGGQIDESELIALYQTQLSD